MRGFDVQIEAIDTFVRIAEIGNFHRAAASLNVTPSTVSARIQILEQSLGQRLFRRSRSSVTLTQAGAAFLPYAQSVVRNWQKGKKEIALPKGFSGILSVAAPPVIWRELMFDFLAVFQQAEPKIAINAVVADPATVAARLNAGEVDLAIFYEPSLKSGWLANRLFTDELILVSTTKRELVRWHPEYVYVDWGKRFSDEHYRAYPVDDTPIVVFSDGEAAANYIRRFGGSAYLPKRWLKSLGRRLHVVPRAPVFEIDAYAVFDEELLEISDRRAMIEAFVAAVNSAKPCKRRSKQA
jgi:DNA-binding transcriptional LysR family regulator